MGLCQKWLEQQRRRGPPCPPPRLRSSERGSGSLHLTQRFSNLISSRCAKGWRPRPDLPGNGVCVKRFLWGGGTCCSPAPPRQPPRPPYRPRCCVMKRVFKLSTGELTLKWCCGGARAGPPGGGGAKSKLLIPLQNVTRVIFELKVFLVFNKGAWVPALPVLDEVKRGKRVHVRLTSGLQMGQNCHGPSPSCGEKISSWIKHGQMRDGTKSPTASRLSLFPGRRRAGLQNLIASLDRTPAGTWVRRRSRSSSRGAVCVADRDVHKHMHTCTAKNTQWTQPTVVA